MNYRRYTIKIIYTEGKQISDKTKTKLYMLRALSLESAIHLATSKFNIDMKGHEVFNCYAMEVKI